MKGTTKVGLYHHKGRKCPWSVRWYEGYDPNTGKPIRPGKAFRLKRDAERFQAEKQAEFDRGARRDRPVDITLGDFCKKYIARRQGEYAEKTRRNIEHLSSRLIAHFGPQQSLLAITPDMAHKFWSQAVRVRPGYEGKQLSRDTRNRLLRDAKTMFRYATEWAHVLTNPFSGIRQVRVGKRDRRSWHYIKPLEYMALLRAAPTLRWKVFYALAYTSAARFGELFNLTAENIDLESSTLVIKNHEGDDLMPPFHVKDHESREIPLPRHTLKLVAGWMKLRPIGSPFLLLTPERYQTVLSRWHNYRAAGKPWLNDYMTNNTVRDIRRHAMIAGLELNGNLTTHCFRKSCGQNWANHLPLNVVKELMGHASVATTEEYYSMVSDEHLAQAQQVTDRITVRPRAAVNGQEEAPRLAS